MGELRDPETRSVGEEVPDSGARLRRRYGVGLGALVAVIAVAYLAFDRSWALLAVGGVGVVVLLLGGATVLQPALRLAREQCALASRLRQNAARAYQRAEGWTLALQRSEQRYRALIENADDLIAEMDEEGNVLYVSPNARHVLRYDPAWLLGTNAWTALHPEDVPGVRAVLQEAMSGSRMGRAEFRYRDGHGDWRWFETKGQPFRGRDGRMRAVLVSRDITERKRAEEATQLANERLQMLLAHLPIVLFAIEADGTVSLCDGKGLAASGLAPGDLVGMNLAELYGTILRDHPDIRAVVERVLSGEPYTGIMQFRGQAGEVRFLPVTGPDGKLVRVLGVAIDITERMRAEQERQRLEGQVWHSQKLESLGVLAGGIAHDFNNLLAIILGNADLALKELPSGVLARMNVERVGQAARRAADLTNQLLAYAGRGQAAPRLLDLSALVASTGELLGVSISKTATLDWQLAEGLPLVRGDAGRITQVILNLITNASEALGGAHGKITIRTSLLDVDSSWIDRCYPPGNLEPGPHVCLEVSDTGCGMDEESRRRMFEPFFTTKPSGHGLGLSAVLGIVRSHRGGLLVESGPDRGTVFRVLFPAAENPQDAKGKRGAEPAWRSRGTVLIVDDEEAIREVTTQMLDRFGFQVLSAADGDTALERIRDHSGEIVAVLLDLTMTGLSGEETFDRLRRILPDVPVVFMSGYTQPHSTLRLTASYGVEFLAKPFTSDDLAGALRRALDRDPGAESAGSRVTDPTAERA